MKKKQTTSKGGFFEKLASKVAVSFRQYGCYCYCGFSGIDLGCLRPYVSLF